ncbi:MAG: hypothetical protein L0I52_07340, partial [Staphylococcus equorum]|nr:hypothetical protein [Staphylococcus equorum]
YETTFFKFKTKITIDASYAPTVKIKKLYIVMTLKLSPIPSTKSHSVYHKLESTIVLANHPI